MENTTISAPYGDIRFNAAITRSTQCPAGAGAAGAAASSDETAPSSKPLLSTLPPPPPYISHGQYQHEVSIAAHSVMPPSCRHDGHEYRQLAMDEVISHPYSDLLSRPGSPDDVPLAHLVAAQTYLEDSDASCTGEAPPSYAVAVRQSYRDTLIQHIPAGQEGYGHVDDESEMGIDMERPDDVRYSVERIAAMFVVAFVLLVVSGVLGWMVLSGALE